MKKPYYVIVILSILLVGSWSWFIYINQKPKTTVDLVEHILMNESFSNLLDTDAQITEEDFNSYKSYFMEMTGVQQFSIIEYNDPNQLLFMQTTPGTVDNQIYIQKLKIIQASDFEKLLQD